MQIQISWLLQIWIYTVCKCRIYPDSAGQGLKLIEKEYYCQKFCKYCHRKQWTHKKPDNSLDRSTKAYKMEMRSEKIDGERHWIALGGGVNVVQVCEPEFRNQPIIHIPDLWKNGPIRILDRLKCWPIHKLPLSFYTHSLVVRQI